MANLRFALGWTDLIASAATRRPWAFAGSNPKVVALCVMTLALQCLRLGIRMVCVERIFGLVFALGVPLRAFHGNLVNCLASFGAVWHYGNARFRGQPLVWLKTEHAYPSRDALLLHRRELADVLVSSGYISEELRLQLQQEMPRDTDLADFLLTNGIIS